MSLSLKQRTVQQDIRDQRPYYKNLIQVHCPRVRVERDSFTITEPHSSLNLVMFHAPFISKLNAHYDLLALRTKVIICVKQCPITPLKKDHPVCNTAPNCTLATVTVCNRVFVRLAAQNSKLPALYQNHPLNTTPHSSHKSSNKSTQIFKPG